MAEPPVKMKLTPEEFIDRIKESHIDFIEDLVYGTGWKLEKVKKPKGKKKNDPLPEPAVIWGENPHDVNVFTKLGHETPLYAACHAGRLEVVQLLLKNQADPNVTNDYGYSPMYWAAYKGHLEIVKALLAAGADPSLATPFNHTPLSRAKEKGHTEVIRVLVKAGAYTQSGEPGEEDVEARKLAAAQEAWDVLIEKGNFLKVHPLAKPGTLSQEDIYGDYEFDDPDAPPP
jgi:ankyrin repeat protein